MYRIYALEHALYEDPVYISTWLKEHGLSHIPIRLYEGADLPDPDQVDLLIIMGGPMNVDEEAGFPWLRTEKEFIRRVIDAGKPTLGICLGGQLLASVLGGHVTRSPVPEYGWYSVRKDERAPHIADIRGQQNLPLFPDRITIFQWHQDTFSIPHGAVRIYTADTCENQAFIYRSHVIGLQFHPEMDEPTIRSFLTASQSELEEKGLLHLKESILTDIDLCNDGHGVIGGIMTYLLSLNSGPEPGIPVTD